MLALWLWLFVPTVFPPVDVPAIIVMDPAKYPCNIPTGELAMCITGPTERWTCEDLTRLLVTTEDGLHHCIDVYQLGQ